MECPVCHRETPSNQSQCIYCGAHLNTKQEPNKTNPPRINLRPIILFIIALVAVLLLLLFNPFSHIQNSSSGSTSKPAASTQSEENAEAEAADSTDSGELSPQADADAADSSETQTEAESPAQENAASVLAAEDLRDIMNMAGSGVNYSVCIADLSSGYYTGVNEEDEVSASAMVAVPILYTAGYLINQDQLSLSTGITFHHTVGGRGKLKASDNGRNIELAELLKAMLQYSDNNATNTLLDYFGMDQIEAVCHDNGYSSVSLNGRIMETTDNTSNDNYVSARDLCGMIYSIYTGVFPDINKSFLFDYMQLQDSTADSGLCNHVGCDYYNLNGVKANKYNEIAIIDNGRTPYVIAYLANDAEREDLESVASTLGQYVYQRVDNIN